MSIDSKPYGSQGDLDRQIEILKDIMRMKKPSDKKFRALLMNIAFRYGYDTQDGNDLYMDAVLKLSEILLVEAIPLSAPHDDTSKSNEDRVKGYLFNGVRYGARKLKRRDLRFTPLRKQYYLASSNEEGINSPLYLHPGLKDVLTEKRYTVLMLRLKGQSYKEIADVLNTTIRNVGECINKAKNAARPFLAAVQLFDWAEYMNEKIDFSAVSIELKIEKEKLIEFFTIWSKYPH